MVDTADEATKALLQICKQLMDAATYTELKDQQIKSASTKCKGVCAAIHRKNLFEYVKHDDAKVLELAENLKSIRAAALSKQVLDIKPQVLAVNACLKA